jgi:dTDP-4-amino-4,6-dideoxygalactose transaminase
MTTLTANASSNYSEETIAKMVETYEANPTRATVDALAEEIGKPVRSIISKLSALGVYVKAEPARKNAEPQVKKEVFVAELQAKLGIELPSIEKMTKADIQRLIAHLG